MNCTTNTDKYKNLVSNFLKNDPEKYSNFDNVAKFILSNPLKDNVKTNTLHHLAVIYNQLHDVTNGEINKGQAQAIIGLVDLIQTNDKQYLDTVINSIYKTVTTKKVTKAQVTKALTTIANIKNLTTLDDSLRNTLDTIDNYLSSTAFKSDQDKIIAVENIGIAYKASIAGKDSEIALQAYFDSKIKKHNITSSFIDLSTIKIDDIAFQNEVMSKLMLQLKNGTYVSITKNDKGDYISDETGEVVNQNDIKSSRTLLFTPVFNKFSDGAETVMFENMLQSGINVQDIGDAVGLNTVSNPRGQVKFYAVPLPKSTDERISTFDDIAKQNSQYSNLTNRKHETYESTQQVTTLQKDKNAIVASIYSPKQSENGFTIVGEFNGKRFNVFSLDNYAFIDSNNRTKKIDFTNPKHLTLVSKTFGKKEYGSSVSQELSADELQTIKSNYQAYQDFKNNVLSNPTILKQLSNGEVTDISNEFHDSFDVNTYRSKSYDNIELLDELEKEDNIISTPLQIATVDEDGQIIKTETKNIPFILIRRVDTNVFSVLNILANNESILYNDKLISPELYFKAVLNKNESADTYAKRILTANDQRQEKLIVTFQDDKLNARYKPVALKVLTNTLGQFNSFLALLNSTLESPDRNSQLGRFSYDYYQIPIRKSAIGNKDAVLDFKISSDPLGKLILEIRPYSTNNRYAFINSSKKDFNIALPEASIKAIYNELLSSGVTPENVADAQDKFMAVMKTAVVDKLETPEMFGDEFAAKFKEDFTINEKFRPDYIFFEYDRNNKISYLKLSRKSKAPITINDSNFNIDNIQIVNTIQSKNSIISPKETVNFTTIPATVTPEKVEQETEIAKEKQEVIKEKAKPSTIRKNNGLHFLLDINGDFDTATDDVWQSQKAWLNNTYPMFGLTATDTEDLRKLTEISPTVLGFMKDKVIYLNEQLKANGVPYHEAFHAVFNYLMNEEERNALLNNVYDNSKHSKMFTNDALIRFAKDRNYVETLDKLKQLQAEEILADGFQTYMVTEKAPKTLLQKFFKMLSNIIRFFKANSNVIDSTFKKIDNGGYANRTIAEIAGNDNARYLAIPGLNIIQVDPIVNDITITSSVLSSSDTTQLTGNVLFHILHLENSKLNFDQKFEKAVKHVLDNVYNINVVTAQGKNQDEKDYLINENANLFKQFRFILGDKNSDNKLYDINLTGNKDYDAYQEENTYKDSLTGETQDNTNGQVSKELLKQIVKKQYIALSNMLSDIDDSDGSSLDASVVNEISEEDDTKPAVELDNVADDELGEDGTEDYDTFMQKSTLDSLPKQVKRFLAINAYQMPHEKFPHVMMPRVIDGSALFPVLLQITSDIKPDRIIDQLVNAAETMIDDGNVKAGMDIMTIYNNLKKDCGIDSTGAATKNKQLHNMFIEVLHVTAMNYAMFNLSFKTYNEGGESVISNASVSLKDKILYEDINKKKNDIINQFLLAYNKDYLTPEYKLNIKILIDILADIKSKDSILESITKYNDAELNELTAKLYDGLKNIGLNFPKSLVRLSLVGIEEKENNKKIDIESETIKTHLEINEAFIKTDKYLNKSFINQLYDILNKNMSPDELNQTFDDASKTYGAFNAILRSASEYIVKYDPTELPTVIRNAEGKLIYRYVKYTPLVYMAKDLRENGFLDFVKQDLEYDNFLESWYKDHPLLSQLMVDPDVAFKKQKGDTAEQVAAKEVAKQKYDRLNTFIKNFNISLYGGSQEFKDGKALKGSTYRNLDSQALQLLSIYSFLKRDEHTVGNETVQTYMRQFAQNETSPTNFLVSGLYEQFANAEGMVMVDGRLKIVQTFKDVIGQEYERIRREWRNREKYKTAYQAKEYNNLRKEYNAVLEKDGVTPNVESEKLRAYSFSKLNKYFEQNQKIKAALIDSAKANIPFNTLNLDEFTETLENNTIISFLDTLEDYAYDQVDLTLQSYVTAGIIKPVQTGVLTDKNNINSFYKKYGKIDVTQRYTSDFISQEQNMQLGYRLESLENLYGKLKGTHRIVKENSEGILSDAGEFGGFNLENFLSDHILNHLHNSLMFNQMFDGDEALNVKGAIDYQKRNKRWLNSGNNYKNGSHKFAMLNTLKVFLHPAFVEAGQYYSLEEIQNDPFTDNVTKEILADSFEKGEYMRDVFDGQSYSAIMHQMDGFETVGKLSPEAVDILIAKHYRDITKKEFNTLKKERIVMNPKKTTTTSRTHYLKLSESYIDRNDVSTLIIPTGMSIKEAYQNLHDIYSQVYANRNAIQAMRIAKEESGIKDLELDNKRLILDAHKYFVAKNSKKHLHVLLNSMELDNVDQVMDTTASKTTTILPVEFARAINKDTEYVNLEIASQLISNEWKYNQVETSKLKNESKVFIQSKLLIPADVLHMKEILGRELTAEEKVQYDSLVDTLADYDQAMKDSAEAGFNTLKTFLRDNNNNIVVGKMYDLIRGNLESQNSPDSIKDLFKTDAAGNPIINQNLPTIRKMLEYYFFSLYSKATDEKCSGTKYIHASSYGHNVTVDENNNVIREEIIEGNPGLYQDNHVRPLGVTVEVGEDGIKRYYVEAIVAKPFFINEEDKEFYLERLNKFFGTRIPTEEKRSMVIVKVVDFLNEAHGNTIILPQFAHYLAGSDFDIDTLYTQMYNVYTDFKGNKQLYGDYSSYRTEDEGKFLEFVNYKLNDRDLSRLVDVEYNNLYDKDMKTDISTATIEVLNMLGFTQEDLTNFINVSQQDFDSVKNELNDSLRDSFNDKKTLKLGIDDLKLKIERKKNKGESIRQLQTVFQEIQELNTEITKLKQDKNEFYENARQASNFYKTALMIESTLNVFSQYGLPTSVDKFNSKSEYKYSVRPVYQNSLLTASMNFISNPLIFKNIYSNQKASTESFDKVLDTQEVDYKDVSKNFPYDHHSISGLISAKVLGQSDKDNVGKSASINKIVAFLNANTLPGESNIKPDAVVWRYNVPIYKEGEVTPSSYKEVIYNTYGIIDQDDNRIIQKIGDSIGMFTDAGKEPKPALLGINDANSTFILSSLGLGLNDNLAFNLIRMPEYINACNAVMNSTKALTRGENVIPTSLYRAVNNEITKLKLLEPDAIAIMQAQGIVSKNSGATNIALDKSKIILEINPGPLNKERLLNNTLTLEDLGIEVSYLNTETEDKTKNKKVSKVIVSQEKVSLSEVQQKIILLQMMKEQALQSFQLSQIGSLVNTMKAFKPDMKSFEFMYDNIVKLKTNQLFLENDVVDRIFSENKLWSTQYEIVKDLNEQAGVLFLEKSPYFRSVYNLFKGSLKDRSVIASTLTSMLSIYKYRTEYPGTRKGVDDVHQLMIDMDDDNLRDAFTARYWFDHKLDVKLNELKEKYPKNKFLSFLRVYKTNKVALTSDNRKFTESYIGLMTKAKVSEELENAIATDAKVLTSVEPLFMSKLFYHDLARTGLQYKQHSYLRYMDASYLKSVSKYMNEFTNKLTTEGGLNVSNAIEQFINSDDIETTYEVLTNIFDTIATLGSEQVENKNLPTLSFGEKGYANRFVETEKITPKGKQTADQAVGEYMQEYLDQIANGIQFNPGKYAGQFVATQTYDVNTKEAKDVTFNFGHQDAFVNQELNKQIARQFGINYDYQNFSYNFPAFLKLNNGLYVLQSVGNNTEEYSVTHDTLAENFMSNLETGMDTLGLQAKYKRINKNVSADQTLSPGTLNQEENETYNNLIATGKRFKNAETYLPVAYEEETPVEAITSKNDNNASEFTNFSGAAKGSDTIWETIGKEFGIGKQVNYTPKSYDELSDAQKQVLESAYEKTVSYIGRRKLSLTDADPKKVYAAKLVRRDYLQAFNAKAIFAISSFDVVADKSKPLGPNVEDKSRQSYKFIVKGGTAYAVHMAIDLGKPVYVFDQEAKKWFTWKDDRFVETETPTLTTKFAGIGTREINEAGIQAIIDVYEKTFNKVQEPAVEVMSNTPTETLIRYTPKGKTEQVYAIRGSKVFNKDGKEVFKENGVDRNKIFANLAVKQKRGVVVEYDGDKYVVNDKQQILSGTTGKLMQWNENNGNRIAILKLASDKLKINITQTQNVIDSKKDVKIDNTKLTSLEIENITKNIAELERIDEALKEYSIEITVANNLSKILPESAKKETGMKTGNTKDISTSLLSKNGVTVQQAAHNIWENHFFDTNVDTETIRDIIIDILSNGNIKSYLDTILNTEKIKDLKILLKNKQQDIKEFENRLEIDMNNLNLTPEVVNYLYEDGSKKLSKESFAIQSKELISILQGSNLTNQEILEKLKCL